MACMSEQTSADPSEAELDIDLLMELHAMTPAEGMARHDAGLQLVQALREAGTNFYGVDPRTIAAPALEQP